MSIPLEVYITATTVAFSVPGGNTHSIRFAHLHSLQLLVGELGATKYPLFLRLGGKSHSEMQPVTSRALLAEIEHFMDRLKEDLIPCLLFRGQDGQELGGVFSSEDGQPSKDQLAPSAAQGAIRVVTGRIPPPAGFRSPPGGRAGQYECYFSSIERRSDMYYGIRTPAMGGTSSPVPLSGLLVPPVTRWDFARVAGRPEVFRIEATRLPIAVAYRDLLHALDSACNESLRLRAALHIQRDT